MEELEKKNLEIEARIDQYLENRKKSMKKRKKLMIYSISKHFYALL